MRRQASERDVLLSTLFSFREWQRFIECRRSVLSEVHFPSNIKYNPEAPGNTHLFLRFLGLMQSKREGEHMKATNPQTTLPELLKKGFQSCFDMLNENLPPMKEIVIFPSSLTPQYSYIQYLLEDPLNDLPSVLKSNFYDTKIGYTTNPHLLEELAEQCEIDLKIIDTNLHFVEKKVTEFDVPLVPSKKYLSEMVIIQKPENTGNNCVKSENLFDYLHRKAESNVSVNYTKKKYYDIVKSDVNNTSGFDYFNEFSFDQIEQDGKLLIPVESDSEDENLTDCVKEINLTSNDSITERKFRKAYNLSLSKYEETATFQSKEILRKHEKTFHRNEMGRFAKFPEEFNEMKKEEPGTSTKVEANELDEHLMEDPEISILKDFNESRNTRISNRCAIFRPYKDYWMYNCIFSRVRLNNFELFEKELPVSFRWLLRECADTIEMSTQDLYEEVCLVEAYCSHVLKPKLEKENENDKSSVNKKYLNSILQKW